MTAKEHPFSFIVDEDELQIPFFQRGYVWEEENWQLLLDGLLDSNPPRFLGSLILKHPEVRSGQPKLAYVIDGQQRLTTLSILFKCLFDIAPADIKPNLMTDKENFLYYKASRTSKEIYPKITHSHIDRIAYEKIINCSSPDALTKEQAESKIIKCYQFFYNELKTKSKENWQNLFNRLAGKGENIWVVIDLAADDNEQAIFDTINSAGVRLSYADTIKNLLFQKAIEAIGKEKRDAALKLYEDTWSGTFEKDEDARNYWLREAQTIRVKRNNIEVFLHAFAIIKGFFKQQEHSIEDLANLYRKQVYGLTFEEIADFLRELVNVASLYRAKMQVFDDDESFSYEDFEKRLFQVLDYCRVTTFHPYILFLYQQHGNDPDVLRTKFHELECFVVRHYLNGDSTRAYNQMCEDLIQGKTDAGTQVAGMNDAELHNAICHIGNVQARLVLFWIELYQRCYDDKCSLKDLKFDYSLEHIMPQKWREKWSDVPVFNETQNELKDPEFAQKARDRMIYQLGNMTLLNSRLNTSIGNESFAVKVAGRPKMEGRRAIKGIQDYADLGITRMVLKDCKKTWDERDIICRTETLYEIVCKLWGKQRV